jgi:hypothetical protein
MRARLAIAVLVIAGLGIYELWGGIQNRNWSYAAIGVWAVISIVGVLLRLPAGFWSTYAFLAAAIGTFIVGVVVSTEMHLWPHFSTLKSVLALVPGLILVAAAVWCGMTIRRWQKLELNRT